MQDTYKIIKNNKFELIIFSLVFLISLLWSIYNVKNFDNNKKNFDGRLYNQIAYHDIHSKWYIADEFRKDLKDGKSFFEALPLYEKYFLPSILLGTYYFLLQEEMFLETDFNQKVVRVDKYKIYYLILQSFFFYLSLFIFSRQLKKKLNLFLYKTILLLLCFDPSILQWQSSFWTESIFLSLMLLAFSIILKKTNNIYLNFILGVIFGFLFLQRPVSFLYIIPISLYYIIILRINFRPFFFLILGYLLIILSLGFNNYKKIGTYHILPKVYQMYSFYHYFGHIIYADKNKISTDFAKNILISKEKEWIRVNSLDINIFNDYDRLVKYRNDEFLKIATQNPIFTIKYYLKKLLTTMIISPFWVHDSYFIDKSDPLAKSDPKKYYRSKTNLQKNIIYSVVLYAIALLGFISYLKKLIKIKSDFDKFLILNVLSVMYFLSISAFWGNPKYLAPCIISLNFFIAYGIEFLKDSYIKYNLSKK